MSPAWVALLGRCAVAHRGQARPAGEAKAGRGAGGGCSSRFTVACNLEATRGEGLMSLAQARQWEAFFPFFSLGFLTLTGVLP